jgi:hypothetical protein
MLTVRIDLGLVNGSREFPKDLMEEIRVSMMRNSVPQKLVFNSELTSVKIPGTHTRISISWRFGSLEQFLFMPF